MLFTLALILRERVPYSRRLYLGVVEAEAYKLALATLRCMGISSSDYAVAAQREPSGEWRVDFSKPTGKNTAPPSLEVRISQDREVILVKDSSIQKSS